MKLDVRQTREEQAAPRRSLDVLWGFLLLGGGLVLLLESLGRLPTTELFWAAVFTVVGLAFLYPFLTRREAWWAAIPAGAVLGLAAASGREHSGFGGDEVGGAAFLALLGAGFVAVYLRYNFRWWALIPGGVCLTLAADAALSATAASGAAQGAVFFFGIGTTFLLLTVLPTGGKRLRWALVPGGVAVAIGVLAAASADAVLQWLNYLWPTALIIAGAYVIWRASGWHDRSTRRE